MTNEELAVKIQEGQTQHYTELWNKNKKLLYKILHTKIIKGLYIPPYIQLEDLQQEMYFALCKAVNAYNREKPYSFNSYLEYSVMNILRDCLPSKPLQESSYNQPATSEDDTELIELMIDENAETKYKTLELTELQKIVRESVAELPQTQYTIITLFYLANKPKSLQEIADKLSMPIERIHKEKNNALGFLGQSKRMKSLYKEMFAHSTGQELANYTWEYSAERQKALQEIKNCSKSLSYAEKQTIFTLAYIKFKHAFDTSLQETGGYKLY